ncbi:MAG TPA: hypothetical protein VIZ63_23055 [Povalibacter sp.]
MGFVTGDENWTTLAVQNALEWKVTLEPMLESVEDYSERRYREGALYEEIRLLTRSSETANKYEHYCQQGALEGSHAPKSSRHPCFSWLDRNGNGGRAR